MKTWISSLIIGCLSLPILAQKAPAIASDIEKQTLTFVERDSALELDFYQKEGDTKTRPCLLFLFGGGVVEGAGHEIAGSPIYDHQPEIWQFIKTAVLGDQRYQMETSLEVLEVAEND